MKQKLKLYLKIGILLFGIPLLIYNCNEDETIIEEELTLNEDLKSGLNITITNYEHLKASNTTITSKFDKYLKNELTQGRTDSNEYGFYIEEEHVQIIEHENYTTYTFIAEREEQDDNVLENYMLKENNDGSYKQYLLKYMFTIDEEGNRIYNTDFLGIQIIDDANLITARGVVCVPEFTEVETGYVCTYNEFCTGSNQHESASDSGCRCTPSPDTCDPAGSTSCGYETIWVYNGCNSGGSTNDNPDDNNDGPNDSPVGGGSTGTNDEPTNDENTDPEEEEEPIEVIPLDDYAAFKSNCKELQKLSQTDEDSANINPRVQELIDLTDESVEYSISYRKNLSGGVETNMEDSDGIIPGDSGTEATIYTGTTYYGAIHTHIGTATQMFSWTDIARLRDLYDNLHEDFTKEDVFLMVVNDNGTIYAAKINDIVKLREELQDDINNVRGETTEEKEEKLTDRLKYKYEKNDNLERTFLKKFKNYGIALYKANDTNLSGWSELELENPDSNNSPVTPKPCN